MVARMSRTLVPHPGQQCYLFHTNGYNLDVTLISFSVLDIVFACSFHYIVNKLMICTYAVCKKIHRLRSRTHYFFSSYVSLPFYCDFQLLPISLSSFTCMYIKLHIRFNFHNVCSQFCAKFDRINGPMPTDRNVYTCIHKFTMSGDVAIYFVVQVALS